MASGGKQAPAQVLVYRNASSYLSTLRSTQLTMRLAIKMFVLSLSWDHSFTYMPMRQGSDADNNAQS